MGNGGNGIFFVFCMASGSMLLGLVAHFTLAEAGYSNFGQPLGPAFEWNAMWSGVSWQLGNLLCPIVVPMPGVGVAVAILDTSDLLTGWASSKFGLFGVAREEVSSPLLNGAGVALACLSAFVILFVEQELRGS
mmetsp:Transcript_67836/g.174839  ORF Transcript_67836/g.174839 Transcript_67836/m.174839 type:complete len:134 (-) Transcript_67836:545-946(-)